MLYSALVPVKEQRPHYKIELLLGEPGRFIRNISAELDSGSPKAGKKG